MGFVENHPEIRFEIEELISFLLIDVGPGLEELFAGFVPSFGFAGLENEVLAFGERRRDLFELGMCDDSWSCSRVSFKRYKIVAPAPVVTGLDYGQSQ